MSKKSLYVNFHENFYVGAKLFHADGQQTRTGKKGLTLAFRSLEKHA